MATQLLSTESLQPASCPDHLIRRKERPKPVFPVLLRGSCAPILLFGMPRSGTTWLGKIFDSHPETLYRHEPDSFGRLNFMPIAPELSSAESYTDQLQRFVTTLTEVRDTKIVASLPDFPKQYLSRAQRLWNTFAIRAAKLEARISGEAKARLWLPTTGLSRAQVVWKSIESVTRLGVIATALPGACGILLLRHPCGYVASVLRGQKQGCFTDRDRIGEDLGILAALTTTRIAQEYGITLDRLQNAHPVERLAWHWVLANDKALLDSATSGRILAIRYEDLCREPLRTTRQMLSWTGLAPSRQTREFLRASTRNHNTRYYSVFKDPRKAAHGWRAELPQRLQRAVIRIAAHSRAGRLFL